MKKSARTKAIDIRGGAAPQMRAGEPRVRSDVKAVGKLLDRFLSRVPSRPFFAVQVVIAEQAPKLAAGDSRGVRMIICYSTRE